MESFRDVYLSKEQFEQDLENHLTIIKYPNRRRKYYICEDITHPLLKRKVKIFIIKG